MPSPLFVSPSSDPSKLAKLTHHLAMYNGFDWYGRVLEVREDRYAGLTGPGFRGGFRGGPRGGLRGFRGGGFAARGGFGGRGGFAGGAGGHGGGRDFNQDIYADYSGPDGQPSAPSAPAVSGIPTGPGMRNDPSYGGFGAPYGANYVEPEPSQQIMVRNVRVSYILTSKSSAKFLVVALVDCQRRSG